MKLLLILLTALVMFNCNATAAYGAYNIISSRQHSVSDSASFNDLFTLHDAERILGQPAILTDSASSRKKGTASFTIACTAKEKDPETGKTGAVYFLAEQYGSVASAQKKYAFIKSSNENHEGIKVIENLGDEAYFHSDNENFYFVMVRKGNWVLSMKVNKITTLTSLENFHAVIKEISGKFEN